MNKICTTIEQSKKLIELGIDVNTADMMWDDWSLIDEGWKLSVGYYPEIEKDYGRKCYPAWSLAALIDQLEDVIVDEMEYELEDIKPYLRPLTSLTDDEMKYLDDLGMRIAPFSLMMEIPFDKITELIDFFNANHLDYRGTFLNGLIDQGLAISTEIHNPYKD